MSVQNTTDSNFENDVVKSETPVLVDFWAEWCGPCKMVSPILDQLAEEFSDKVKIVKVNIDQNPETPTKYGVRGIPTMMIFKNGEITSTKVGAAPKQALADWVNEAL